MVFHIVLELGYGFHVFLCIDQIQKLASGKQGRCVGRKELKQMLLDCKFWVFFGSLAHYVHNLQLLQSKNFQL